ncbi:MAG: GTP cyclohydrolase II [Rhodobacteraceae bacterium]|nr:GTP cyclohydrolase II [Paracoccaceae bacterium]
MTLALTAKDRVARAVHDLRLGLPVVLRTGAGNVLIASAETVSKTRWRALSDLGAAVLAITARRAETLSARAYDDNIARIQIPNDADIWWVRAVADPSHDLDSPMKGPFVTLRGGSADAHRIAITLCKRANLLPAAIVVAVQGDLPEGLTVLAADDLDHSTSPILKIIASARVPLAVSELGRVHVFRPDDGSEEHYAIEIGTPDRAKPVLTRLHSACFTGDLIGSLKCDCGPQLRAALTQIGTEGAGILLYMNQEGRGIGLANKMRAYALQDQGFDTVEANHRLGFEDDERDFTLGAQMLRTMGFNAVRLMTNNPAKIAKMLSCGLDVVERVALKVGKNAHNAAYLATKASKSGHLL